MYSSVLVPAQPLHSVLGVPLGQLPLILSLQGKHRDLWQLLCLWMSFPFRLVTHLSPQVTCRP